VSNEAGITHDTERRAGPSAVTFCVAIRLEGDIDRVLVAATADDPATVRNLFDGDA
jgi:hypothetical protein